LGGNNWPLKQTLNIAFVQFRYRMDSQMRTSRTPSNKGCRLPPEPLTQDEVRALLKACSDQTSTGIRNRALIAVLYRCGLRVSEALSLMPKDCDARAGTIRVLHGKGDRSRLVGIDPGAASLLEEWLNRRQTLDVTGRHAVFSTASGNALQSAYVRNLLKRLAVQAGIEKRVHPHGLRHTHAYELANEGTPLHVIQQQLGHSSLATTDRYIRHLNPQQVVAAIRGRTWEA
jgi:site-specific recombinase XerD